MQVSEHIRRLLTTTNVLAMEQGLVALYTSVPSQQAQPIDRGWPSVLVACSVLDAWAKDAEDKRAAAAATARLLNDPALRVGEQPDQGARDRQRLAFKKLVERRLVVLPVRGDGNCMYRSVVRILFGGRELPEDFETQMCQQLRQACCKVTYDDLPPAEKARTKPEDWAAFNTIAEKDSSQFGVWADATEVYRLSILLRNEICTIRYDDQRVSFVDGTVKPDDNYVLCKGSFESCGYPIERIGLLYDPYGHYDGLIRHEDVLRSDAGALLEQLQALAPMEPSTYPRIVELACALFFAVSKEAAALEDGEAAYSQSFWQRASDVLVQAVELKVFLRGVPLAQMRRVLPRRYMLHMALFGDMCEEWLDISFKQMCYKYEAVVDTDRRSGPLSNLCLRLCGLLNQRSSFITCQALSRALGDHVLVEPTGTPRARTLSELLQSAELAQDPAVVAAALRAITRAPASVKGIDVSREALERVLDALPQYTDVRKLAFVRCALDFDTVFVLLEQAAPKGLNIVLDSCSLPEMMRDTIEDDRHFDVKAAKWV